MAARTRMIKGAPPEVIASTLQRLHQQNNKPDRVLKRLVERFTALLEQQADPLAVSGQFDMDETLELAEHYDVERNTDNVQSGAKPQSQKDLFIDVWWIAAAKMRKQASTQEKASPFELFRAELRRLRPINTAARQAQDLIQIVSFGAPGVGRIEFTSLKPLLLKRFCADEKDALLPEALKLVSAEHLHLCAQIMDLPHEKMGAEKIRETINRHFAKILNDKRGSMRDWVRDYIGSEMRPVLPVKSVQSNSNPEQHKLSDFEALVIAVGLLDKYNLSLAQAIIAYWPDHVLLPLNAFGHRAIHTTTAVAVLAANIMQIEEALNKVQATQTRPPCVYTSETLDSAIRLNSLLQTLALMVYGWRRDDYGVDLVQFAIGSYCLSDSSKVKDIMTKTKMCYKLAQSIGEDVSKRDRVRDRVRVLATELLQKDHDMPERDRDRGHELALAVLSATYHKAMLDSTDVLALYVKTAVQKQQDQAGKTTTKERDLHRPREVVLLELADAIIAQEPHAVVKQMARFVLNADPRVSCHNTSAADTARFFLKEVMQKKWHEQDEMKAKAAMNKLNDIKEEPESESESEVEESEVKSDAENDKDQQDGDDQDADGSDDDEPKAVVELTEEEKQHKIDHQIDHFRKSRYHHLMNQLRVISDDSVTLANQVIQADDPPRSVTADREIVGQASAILKKIKLFLEDRNFFTDECTNDPDLQYTNPVVPDPLPAWRQVPIPAPGIDDAESTDGGPAPITYREFAQFISVEFSKHVTAALHAPSSPRVKPDVAQNKPATQAEPLNRLIITSAGLSDAGVASIAGVLCVNNSIQLLQSEVEQNRQSVLERRCPEGELQVQLSRCVPLFTRSAPLRELHLWGNHIGDAGAVSLANALVFNRGLQVLYLHSNRISDLGASILARALFPSAASRLLHAHGLDSFLPPTATASHQTQKTTSKAEMTALGAIGESCALQFLDLHNNLIGDEGANNLAEMLKVNVVLQTLYLHGNKRIGKAGIHALKEAAAASKTLQNYVGPAGRETKRNGQDIPDLDEVDFKDEENQERKSTSTCLLS